MKISCFHFPMDMKLPFGRKSCGFFFHYPLEVKGRFEQNSEHFFCSHLPPDARLPFGPQSVKLFLFAYIGKMSTLTTPLDTEVLFRKKSGKIFSSLTTEKFNPSAYKRKSHRSRTPFCRNFLKFPLLTDPSVQKFPYWPK